MSRDGAGHFPALEAGEYLHFQGFCGMDLRVSRTTQAVAVPLS